MKKAVIKIIDKAMAKRFLKLYSSKNEKRFKNQFPFEIIIGF